MQYLRLIQSQLERSLSILFPEIKEQNPWAALGSKTMETCFLVPLNIRPLSGEVTLKISGYLPDHHCHCSTYASLFRNELLSYACMKFLFPLLISLHLSVYLVSFCLNYTF